MSSESAAPDHVERDPEHRVASVACRARHLVAHRVGRSRDRHVADRHVDGGRRRRASAAGPRRSRARGARGSDWRPPAGRDEDAETTSGSSSKPSPALTAGGCGSIERRRPGRCPRCTRSTTSRRRRQSPTASASMPGSATVRSSRSTWTAVSSGRGISASSSRRSGRVGTRQLAGPLRRAPHSAMRSSLGRVPAGGRRAHGTGAMEGGSRRRAHVAQHAARRQGPGRRRAAREFVRAHRRLRSLDRKAALVHRRHRGRRRFPRPSSTTAGSI